MCAQKLAEGCKGHAAGCGALASADRRCAGTPAAGDVRTRDRSRAVREILARAAHHFGVPVTISSNIPRVLGAHRAGPLLGAAAGEDARVFAKMTFSCAREPALAERICRRLADARPDQIVVCGIEAHVCVLQSAVDLRVARSACDGRRRCHLVAAAAIEGDRAGADAAGGHNAAGRPKWRSSNGWATPAPPTSRRCCRSSSKAAGQA